MQKKISKDKKNMQTTIIMGVGVCVLFAGLAFSLVKLSQVGQNTSEVHILDEPGSTNFNTTDIGEAYLNMMNKSELLTIAEESIERLEGLDEDTTHAEALKEIILTEYTVTCNALDELERKYTGGFTYGEICSLVEASDAILQSPVDGSERYQEYFDYYNEMLSILTEIRASVLSDSASSVGVKTLESEGDNFDTNTEE